MAIFIVKSVCLIKNGMNEIIRLDMKAVWRIISIWKNMKAEGCRGLKYDLEYDICLYFEYILNLEGHTLKNSFMSDFTLYFALATGRIATIQSINQS